jgi:hypothetical protein
MGNNWDISLGWEEIMATDFYYEVYDVSISIGMEAMAFRFMDSEW